MYERLKLRALAKKQRRNNINKRSDDKKPSSKNPNGSTTRGGAEGIANSPFPEDIISEILSRLPVKSLLRFRCICKYWHAIIHSPSFVDAHLIRPCEPQILVSFSGSDSKHYFYSASLEGGPAVRLLSLPGCNKGCYVSESLNGLVCFHNGSDIYVLNPSTRSVKTLPAIPYNHRYSKPDNCGSECISYSTYSFGFDPSKKEYKVLHIMGRYHRCNAELYDVLKLYDMQCEVFTIKGSSSSMEPNTNNNMRWRKISHVPPYPYTFRGQGVCVDGAIYWICTREDTWEEVLVVFDVGSEEFSVFPLPDAISWYNLRQVGGRLALLNHGYCDGSAIQIWVLEDCHNMMWVEKNVMAPQKYDILLNTLSPSRGKYRGFSTTHRYQFISLDHRDKTTRPIRIGGCYQFIPCDHWSNTTRPIRIDGVPSWNESNGTKNIQFSITGHVDSFICLS